MTNRYTASGTMRGLALATALAGTLTLLAAFVVAIVAGSNPVVVLTRITSGMIGDAAWQNPVMAPLLGLVLHFLGIAILANSYAIAAIRIRALGRYWLPGGIVLGLLAWAAMNWGAAPLEWPATLLARAPGEIALQITLPILLLGVPIALITKLARRWHA